MIVGHRSSAFTENAGVTKMENRTSHEICKNKTGIELSKKNKRR